MANGLIGMNPALCCPDLPGVGSGEPTDRQLLERFHRSQDGTAFEALVRRHGAMVLGVCRRVLENTQDAEDAFQATFLVLVRKAGSVAQPELLGNWLYGVAFRIARKVRAQAARRRDHERQAETTMTLPDPVANTALSELRVLLDQELQRLPEKYRAPLVLCYLEGLTNQEAARRLGWPSGSISARLARGRELLRKRLEVRQASALPAGMLLPLLIQQGTTGLPAPLVQSTVQAALALAAGKGAAISATVQALIEQAVNGLAGKRRTWADLGLLLLLLLGLFFAVLFYAASTGPAHGFSPAPDTGSSNTTANAGTAPPPACGCH